ncbi:uncharacterized protein LAESUDRAFT_764619 [Laetiporus sulphureus 93-53]|uniref:Secreted protein n=1 Tax=Laetiporus sulphureus 93-53 TaxID=1314785 RepID=A0A165B7E4_9APHY|nr:uncharacterized protein LAESUDRAFT_764619 [Laetiporus sulphureus 93-53]KZT00415.1 hypothetical protein LAESUDRAFT_764619 [Laetiporus sulphureus 93-53]
MGLVLSLLFPFWWRIWVVSADTVPVADEKFGSTDSFISSDNDGGICLVNDLSKSSLSISLDCLFGEPESSSLPPSAVLPEDPSILSPLCTKRRRKLTYFLKYRPN